MSWLYSQALVEEYLGEHCLDGEPFAQLSKTNTQLAFLPQDKMTAFSRLSRFGMTFAPLTADRGAELLTSYLAGFHAKTSQLQERALESKATEAGYGKNLRGLLAKFDPATCSLKTAQCSLFAEVSELFQTLPRSGILQNGCVYLLPIAERHTNETDSGLWATPTTMDKLPPKSAEALHKEATQARPGRSNPANLRDQVSNMQNWPTPRVLEVDESYENYMERMKRSKNPKNNTKTKPNNLTMAVKMAEMQKFPTPTAHMAKETNAPSESKRNEPTLSSIAGGHLNPEWVEWLMGWPQGWTDLAPLETDKFQEWQQQHGAN
jgi:hypothetical protein